MPNQVLQFLNPILDHIRVAPGSSDDGLLTGHLHIGCGAQHIAGDLPDVLTKLFGDICSACLDGQILHTPFATFSIKGSSDAHDIHITFDFIFQDQSHGIALYAVRDNQTGALVFCGQNQGRNQILRISEFGVA